MRGLTSARGHNDGGGRAFLAAAAVVLACASAIAADRSAESVTVTEDRGVYAVAARFEVDRPAALVMSVLTDYDEIPRFMPNIDASVVRERSDGHAIVEQDALAHALFISKRVHLVLDVHEQTAALTFRDRCGTSFKRYEGAWRLSEHAGGTAITYELTAEPAFDVPAFLLKRLLGRDSTRMIERLRREIASR